MAAAASRIGTAVAGKARTAAEVGVAAQSIRNKAPKVKLNRTNYKGAQRPVITTMTVVIGLGFLDAWLVEKKPLPDRPFLVRLAILGFGLTLLTEISPKFGKGMSYLILTGVVFDRSQKILQELTRDKPAEGGGTGGTGGTGPGPSPLTPQATPIVLYQRQGPMTTEPLVPTRSRIRPPRNGAAFQTS